MNPVKTKRILKLGEHEGFELVSVPETKPKRKKRSVYTIIQASEIGFSIALPIVMGALFGFWLDQRLDSAPILTLLLLLVGIFFAFTNLFLLIRNFIK